MDTVAMTAKAVDEEAATGGAEASETSADD